MHFWPFTLCFVSHLASNHPVSSIVSAVRIYVESSSPLILGTIISYLDFCHSPLSGLCPHSCSCTDILDLVEFSVRSNNQIMLLFKSVKAFSLYLKKNSDFLEWQPNPLDLAFDSCLSLREGNTCKPNA